MGKYGKLIRVTCCNYCPRLSWQWNKESTGYTVPICRMTEFKKIDDLNKIPKWCPLEDYP